MSQRSVTGNRGSMLAAAFLIIGALCLRVFVMPVRHALPLQTLVLAPVYSGGGTSSSSISSSSSIQRSMLLSTNPSGAMANDIVSMEHVPDQSSIIVTLKPDGRCPNPYLRGRLSGPALVMLEWSSSSSSPSFLSKVGRYRVPISGTYFVEIISITCQDFSRKVDFDFQNSCVEDVLNHRLTKFNVKIHIDKDVVTPSTSTASTSLSTVTGYWLHQQDERAANNDYAALYTRFQPRGCMRMDDPTHENFENPPTHCIEPTDLNRFEPYTTFQYYRNEKRTLRPSSMLPINGAKELRADKPTTLCLVGASHSRTLKASMDRYHNITMQNNNIQIEWINAKLPRNVNNKTIAEQLVGNCDKIIIAIGQWPASFSGNKPTSFQDYNLQMQQMFLRLQHFLGDGVEIFARSIHDNPLNAMISGYCPPKDWRSPTVIDGYNAIIRQACHDATVARSTSATTKSLANIRFVDTNFIVGPLWDASSDWGHVCPQAAHVEALYLVAVAMGLLA